MPSAITDLKCVRAACAVHSLGSTVQAATVLRVSQSSVTRAIQELEAASGHALFYRMGRGMRATEESVLFLARAGRALGFLAVLGGPEGRAGLHALSWLVSRFATGLNLRHMLALLSLGRTLSMAQAARELGVGTSAMHQTLGQLEHLAGVVLFVRSRRGLRLTESGEQALHAVKLARAELQHAEQHNSWQRGTLRGQLVIGTLPFSAGLLLPQAVEAVLSAHPGMAITIVDGTHDALVQRLREAELDVMLGALRPEAPAGLQQETLFEDRLAVVARGGHPLAGRTHLAWPDLAAADWIMPMTHTPAQTAFEQALAAAGLAFPPSPLRVNSALMMQTLLAETDRLALMSPRQVQRELRAGLLVELSVQVAHLPRPIGMVWRVDYLPPPGAVFLLERFRALGLRLSESG